MGVKDIRPQRLQIENGVGVRGEGYRSNRADLIWLPKPAAAVAQIVAIIQHSLATATRILEVYLSPTKHLANQAIAQLENANRKG